MAQVDPSPDVWKQAMKEALAETFAEQRQFFHDVFAEVLEDVALAEAIREGESTEAASREEIFDRLEDQA